MEKLYVICGILALGLIVAFVFILSLSSKLKKMKKEQKKLEDEMGNESIEKLLIKSISKQENILQEISKIKFDVENLEEKQKHCFDKLEIVRYPASSEIGPKLSYSVGLTNEVDDALIITGLHYRQGLQVYYKQVKEGVPEIELSEEEKSVVRRNKADYVMGKK